MNLLVFLLGIVVSIIGFSVQNFLLKPIVEYKNEVRRIGANLRYYSHIITSPGSSKLADEASPALRQNSIKLEELYLVIPFANLLSKTGVIHTDKQVSSASGGLIFLSNSVHSEGKTSENMKVMKEIYTELNIKELVNRYNFKDKK